VCCDLDGVVWRGDEPVPGAAGGVAALRAGGLRVAFLSNNSSLRIAEVVQKLARCGVPADPTDVLTSAVAAAALLRADLPAGARVLVTAGPGVDEALAAAGLEPVHGGACDAVVVGFHRSFDFEGLARAASAVRAGARFVSTNLDATYPVPGDLLPGAGSITAAVAVAAGRTPEVAGKPAAPMVGLVRERFGEAGIMVGDRPSTDGALATALGWPFALVLSGVAARAPGAGHEPVPDPPPPFVASDLGVLAPLLLTAVTRSAPDPHPVRRDPDA
jgi:HAD superfamily hydrolase (TIGR01450 family)